MTQLALALDWHPEPPIAWWVVPVAILRALALAVLAACDAEPRWMVRR